MMWKTARVVALTFALFGSMSFAQNGFAAAYAEDQSASTQDLVVTEATISRLKDALRLQPAQEIHWRTLEATLRDVAQKPQQESSNVGFVQRVRTRMKSYVLDLSAARRVAAAAHPLIESLDEDQKREGLIVVRALGVASLF